MDENAESIVNEVETDSADNYADEENTGDLYGEEDEGSGIDIDDADEGDADDDGSTADGGEDDEPRGEEKPQPKKEESGRKTERDADEPVDYNEVAAKKRANDDALVRNIDKFLKSYGYDEGTLEERLEKAVAETEGKTVEEFRKEEAERRQAEENARIVQQINAQRVFAADIAALKAQYPELDIKDIRDIPNFEIFAKARTAHLDAVQAFAAANPNYGRESGARSARQNSLNGTKDHLRSSKPAGNTETVEIPDSEMRQYRELFPDKTDKQIRALYKSVTAK